MRFLVVIAFVLVELSVFQAHAFKLTGKVVVTKELREALERAEEAGSETERSYYWNQPNGILPVQLPQVRLPGEVAVVLEKEGAKAPQVEEPVTVKVFSGELERKVIAVRPGGVVRFQSIDPFNHELYSPGLDDFRPESQSTGGFRPVEFKKSGVYQVRCKLMPHLKAYVVVTEAMAILKVEQDGSFSLDDLDEGKYAIKAFFNGEWVYNQAFEVDNNKKGSTSIEINLTVEAAAAKSDASNATGKPKPEQKKAKP